MGKRLMIIDGYSLANRAFFALPPLTTSNGQPTNAVYGMAMMLLKLLEEAKPDYFLAAFDVAAPTFRHQEYTAYKGQRLKMEDSLKSQIPLIRRLLEIMRIPVYEMPGFEADDLIGTFAKKASSQGLKVEIVTGDRDSFQLVDPGIKVLYTRKGITELDRVDEAYIQERYQLRPEQLVDLKGLMGDASDNIPGVPGVGEKTALRYLHEYSSLEAVYDHLDEISRAHDRELLGKYKEQAFLSRHLARIVTNLDLPLDLPMCCRHLDYDSQELLRFCQENEFNSLVRKLSGNAAPVETRLREIEFQVKSIDETSLTPVLTRIEQQKSCYLQFCTAAANWVQIKPLGLGLGTAEPGENWFYPMDSGGTIPESLRRMLADPGVVKIGHDLKKQMQIAAGLGITLAGPFEDTMIAGYLISAGSGDLELEALCQTYLGLSIPGWRNERSKLFPVFNLPEDIKSDALARITGGRIAGIRGLLSVFQEQLKEETSETASLKSLYYDVELPLVKVLFSMERTGVKVDPESLRGYGKTLKLREKELEVEIYRLAGEEFNINSPKQLGALLFEKLGLKAPKKTKTGYSTDAEVLDSLAEAHPIIPQILEYRQNQKLQSTYIDSLITLIHPRDGRVHTTFNQAVTTTGRLSSTEPNLQNIPIRSEEGRMIRRAFVAEEGNCLLSADYSQIELRIMAHFSQDPAFREAFIKGDDIHRFTAAAVYGVPVTEVTREMRDKAKAVNFGIIYGISGFGLAKNIGVSRKEAEIFIETYFSRYPGVQDYVNQLIETAKATGEARTLLGRIRKLPDLYSRNFTLRSFAERTARNTPIQGTAADIIKLAMVRIEERLAAEPELGKLLLQVHDELVFEVSEKNWRELAAIVQPAMEHAVDLSVPLTVAFKKGTDWCEMVPVEF
ncbi:MAG TPA: DNA polymerase I [Bacillota bacterium]